MLAALDRSGETVAAFARKHGVTPQRLYWWRHRLRGQELLTDGATPSPASRLVPVRIRYDQAIGSAGDSVVVRLTGGVAIEVPASVTPMWVAALVRELEES